jgi:biotin-(acetyl-CoA carboxylase) ligase
VGYPPHRPELLREVVSAILRWRPKLAGDEFMHAWESWLAFRGEQVQISGETGLPLTGTLSGLESDGSLRLLVDGKPVAVQVGEIHLRPAA